MATKSDVLGNYTGAAIPIAGAGARWRPPVAEAPPKLPYTEEEIDAMIEETHRRAAAKAASGKPSATTNGLAGLLDEASRAVPYTLHHTSGSDEPKYLPKKAAAMRALVLASSPLPTLIGADGRIVRDPRVNDAGESIMLDVAIARMSRTIEAGAQLIVLPEPGAPRREGDTVIFQDSPAEFVSIAPATFSLVADDTDTVESPLPIKSATVNRLGQQYGVRMRVNRRTQSVRGPEQVAAELMVAITAGIAKTCDSVLLKAIRAAIIAAYAPAAAPWYTPARAAAAGMRFTSLRGIVGTADVPLAITGDGELVLDGVSAELSPAIAESIIGDFSRSAVVIDPELTVYAERLNVDGDLVVQAWLNISAAVPDAKYFFVQGNP